MSRLSRAKKARPKTAQDLWSIIVSTHVRAAQDKLLKEKRDKGLDIYELFYTSRDNNAKLIG